MKNVKLGYKTVYGTQFTVHGLRSMVWGKVLEFSPKFKDLQDVFPPLKGWAVKFFFTIRKMLKFFPEVFGLHKTVPPLKGARGMLTLKTISKLVSSAILFLLFLTPLTAQIEKSNTIEKEFDLGKSGVLKIDHRYGLLKVVQSTDGKVHIDARMRVEGGDEEAIQTALNQFDLDINEFGSQVTVETDLGIKNWQGRNGKINLTFKDGTRVKGLKKFTAEMLIAVPSLEKLELKNKYEDIIIDHDLKSDLSIVLYDGDLKAKNVAGDFELEIKYGKAFFQDVQDADLTLYDSEMEMEGGKSVRLSSKYSEFTIGDTENLEIKAYDDKMELGNVKEKLEITDKYSEIELGSFKEAVLDIYDADLAGKSGQKLTIDDSKYSKYRFTKIDELILDDIYDDEFILRTVNNLQIGESKYTEFELGSLSGQIDWQTSYDDKLNIAEISDSFKGLKVNGKYTKINIDIPASIKYELDVEMTHGGVIFPEDDFDSQYYKEKGSTLEVKGKISGAGENAPKVVVRGYDCKVELE